jgi:hypothetical protein
VYWTRVALIRYGKSMVDRSLGSRRALRDFRRATRTGEPDAIACAAVAYAFASLPERPTAEDWARCWGRLEALGSEAPLDPDDPAYQLARSIMRIKT